VPAFQDTGDPLAQQSVRLVVLRDVRAGRLHRGEPRLDRLDVGRVGAQLLDVDVESHAHRRSR
jgi:hypothetical protein